MSSSSTKLKCKKCHCSIAEDSNGRLCDNCNMDLIAQNLAAELSQHEIHHQDANDDNSPGASNDSSPLEIKIENIAQKLQSSLIKKDTLDSDNFKTQFSVCEYDPTDGEIKTENGKLSQMKQKEDKVIDSSTSENKSDEQSNISDSLPSTSFSTPTRNESRKRKMEETAEQMDKSSKMKEDESSDEETEAGVKKRDVKPEPMRTRAKVVQEEAAALKQFDLSIDEERLGIGENDEAEDEEDSKGPIRRLTRKALSEIEKYKHPSYEPLHTKSRRTKTFKAKPVYKAPTSQARIYSSDYVFYKGRYFQIGDIVLLRDTKRPGDFFAQITSFLTDQYCHKCATIQWLFPTKQSPISGFDPRTYFLGYLDEIPRPLSSLQPVMNLPSDYYRFNKTPYPPPTPDPLKKHYLWKRTEPVSLEALQQG